MPIVLARIDDRLVHGQVVEGWLRIVGANSIAVVSDKVANDKMQHTLFSIAVPANVKIGCYTVDDAADKIMNGFFKIDRVLLLFSSPQDVLRLIKKGIKIASINVGGMHYVEGKKQISRTLSVDESDVASLREIAAAGVELEGRILPNDDKVSVIDIIEKCIKSSGNTLFKG